MKIIVRDNLGKDVTHEREWYINTDGKVFYYTGDIDVPLYIVDNDYTWEIVPHEYGYMYYVTDIDNIKRHAASANRIAEAVNRTKKYVRE